MAKSTPVQSSIFDLLTPAQPDNATSSPGSAAGPTPSTSPAGLEIAKSWTPPCRVSRFRSQENEKGAEDDRHLWPVFYRLVRERRPATIFGEQVASKDGREWLAAVRADLEAIGYAVGAACLPACSVGAPHRRYRLFWVAHHDGGGQRSERREGLSADGDASFGHDLDRRGAAGLMADGTRASDGEKAVEDVGRFAGGKSPARDRRRDLAQAPRPLARSRLALLPRRQMEAN